MRILEYFPLHVVLLLWLHIRFGRSKNLASIDRGMLLQTEIWLLQLKDEVERSEETFLKNWLVDQIVNQIEVVKKMLTMGTISIGFIEKDK